MGFKTSLDLLRFIEKNRKKIKEKEQMEVFSEGIQRLKSEAMPRKRKKGERLEFENDMQAAAYKRKMMQRKLSPEEYEKYMEDILKRREATESEIQDTIDSTIFGRPPRSKKYKKGGVPKFAAGGIKKFFIDPILGRIDGYSSKKQFDAAVKKFNKDNNVDDIPSSKDDNFEFQEYDPDIHGPADKPPVPSRKGQKTPIKKSIGGVALKGFKNKTPIY